MTVEEAIKISHQRDLNDFEKELSNIISRWIISNNYPGLNNTYQIILDADYLVKKLEDIEEINWFDKAKHWIAMNYPSIKDGVEYDRLVLTFIAGVRYLQLEEIKQKYKENE